MSAVGYGTDGEPLAEPEPADDEISGSRRWSVGARLLTAAAAVVLILGTAAVVVIIAQPQRLGMTYSSTPDGGQPDGARPDGDAAGADAESTVTAPLAGWRTGAFVLADGLTSFDLQVADLGDDLYRISSPAGSAVAARPAVLGGTVRLGVVDTGASGARTVRVLLNERVEWRLRLAGGVGSQRLDLTRARLLGVELAGGSARTEVLLPPITPAAVASPASAGGPATAGRPAAAGTTAAARNSAGPGNPTTMTVRLTGGTSQLDVRVPGETPVRVRVGAGAGSVSVREARWDGVAAGTLLGTPGWDRATERVFLDLVAGANSVTVTSS
ncbi:hypothetical protein O7634_23820 [Micromonospora sp. WMMD1120]|uniref:hypothetical protein n=1 Tax=Micromonospora sp. WMMD1120 TaxID=3016106 RepID=UPI002417744A|nr:hypothetical protein [Micromonospora sp. WMMD1120]MDG4809791.1 hypothetical protein [Micromonospora sp. WMMD1120]